MAEITRKRSGARLLAALLAALLPLAACGGNDDDNALEDATDEGVEDEGVEDGDDQGDDAEEPSGPSESAGDIPDACVLLSVEEISAVIGREVSPGEPETTPEDTFTCDFQTVTGIATSTTYDDPAIPEMFGGRVTISTARSSAVDFDDFEELVGDEAEVVSGLGDDAFFWGGNILYVRVADRGLTVRIEADDADDDAVRAAVLELAELGVSKL